MNNFENLRGNSSGPVERAAGHREERENALRAAFGPDIIESYLRVLEDLRQVRELVSEEGKASEQDRERFETLQKEKAELEEEFRSQGVDPAWYGTGA